MEIYENWIQTFPPTLHTKLKAQILINFEVAMYIDFWDNGEKIIKFIIGYKLE